MPSIFEMDDQGLRILGYNQGIRFYDPDRNLQQEIYLQEDDTLNIGEAAPAGGGGGGAAAGIQTIIAGPGLDGGGSSSTVTLYVNAGEGIQIDGDDVALDIDGLTVQASPSGDADYIAIWDAGESEHRKVLLDNLYGEFGLTGLTDHTILRADGTDALQDSGVTIDDSDNIEAPDGTYLSIDQVRARDGDGLKLYDDGGNGIFVKDGGSVGIGDTDPDYPLEILSTSAPQFAISYDDGVDYATFGVDDNGDLTISPSGDQIILDDAHFEIHDQRELRFYEGVNYVGFEAPSLSGNTIWVLPDDDGTANQVIETDGSGNLSWTTVTVDIDGLADLAAPATDDELLISDTSDGGTEKRADVQSVLDLIDSATGDLSGLAGDNLDWDAVDNAIDLGAHKDLHDPEDGDDPLDCAAAGEIVGVTAAAEGSAHSFARSDHTHQIQHSIADNHIVTVDGSPVDDEYARWTADGLEGVTAADLLADLLPAFTDNRILRADGADDIQDSGITIDDSDNVTMPDGTWIGIGAAAERIVFDGAANDIEIMDTRVGIDNTSPSAKLDVLDASIAQLRLSYDQTTYCDFEVDVNGDITVTPSGDQVIVSGANINLDDGYAIGIQGNELLTVNAAGTFAFSGITGVTVENGDWIGIGAAAERIVFDAGGDDIELRGADVAINTDSPGARLGVLDSGGAQLRLMHTQSIDLCDFTVDTNGDLTISPSGDQIILDDAHFEIHDQRELRFYEGVNYVGFEAPSLSGNTIWVLPDDDGTANQVIETDGSGNLSWTTVTVDIDGLADLAAPATDDELLISDTSDGGTEKRADVQSVLDLIDSATGDLSGLAGDNLDWDAVDNAIDLGAHKDLHDPEDGDDPLDCAAAGEIVGVTAAAEGSAHSFARSDHTHQIQHSIADNHIVTVDGVANQPIDNDYAKFTSNGLEGRSYSQVADDIEGSIDHGNLTGLADDDHTQYFLVAGETTTAKLYNSAELRAYSDAGSTLEIRLDTANGNIYAESGAYFGASAPTLTPADGDVYYNGELHSQKTSGGYAVYGFHPLTTPISRYSGTSFSDTGSSTKIENTDWGSTIPAEAQALLIRIAIRDSGSSGSSDAWFAVGPTSTYYYAVGCYAYDVPNNTTVAETGVCPCSSGDIYYRCGASGASTLDVWLECWGYWI